MTDAAPTDRRLLMPDGAWWTAWFRHEMTQLQRRGRERERDLYVFFQRADGALRRAEVTDAFKASATDDDLRSAWGRALTLHAGGGDG
ncbi:MAG TPA: hypothetical protein VF041_00685 [Gemmatimonadaceae bacterium]